MMSAANILHDFATCDEFSKTYKQSLIGIGGFNSITFSAVSLLSLWNKFLFCRLLAILFSMLSISLSTIGPVIIIIFYAPILAPTCIVV